MTYPFHLFIIVIFPSIFSDMSNPNALNIHIDRGDGYFISTDRSKLNIERICEWISTDCYWAIGRPHEVIRTSIENSLAFGVYTLTEGGTEEQIAFARVVTDYCTSHPQMVKEDS